MAKKILHLYPNCSLGGMTTVYRNRALADPDNHYTFLFANDKSGSVAYQSISNVDFRIIRPDRYEAMVEHAAINMGFDLIRVTSYPSLIGRLAKSGAEIVYEFHSSDEKVIERELSELDVSVLSGIATPSLFLAELVKNKLTVSQRGLVQVLPNLVDETTFSPNGDVPELVLDPGTVPLLWIGRLDKGKNASDFLRVLSLLPEAYVGIVILSFEDQPNRMADFLGLAASLGVDSRVKILLNLNQTQIAGMYRYARVNAGFFCSTSLGESYGYGVAEALSAGLNSVAYQVGALGELRSEVATYELVPVGDLHRFAEYIVSAGPSHAIERARGNAAVYVV